MIYRFRVTLNGNETTFRDIEIEATNSFEDFHNVILQSFGFDGLEMASFYLANEEWEPLEEITLFDMSEEEEELPAKLTMQDSILGDILDEDQTRLVYIYDFLSLWTFKIELADISEREASLDYPNLLFAQGELDFGIEEEEEFDENGDPYVLEDEDEDNYDIFDDPDNFQDYDSFNEEWN